MFWENYDRLCRELVDEQNTQGVVVQFHRRMARSSTRSAAPAPTCEPTAFQVQGDSPLCWPLGTSLIGRAAALYVTGLQVCWGLDWRRSRPEMLARRAGCLGRIWWSTSSRPTDFDLFAVGLPLGESQPRTSTRPLSLGHGDCVALSGKATEAGCQGGRASTSNHRNAACGRSFSSSGQLLMAAVS